MKDEERIVFRQGENVYIRPISKEDMPMITVHINDQETSAFLSISEPMSIEEETAWYENLAKSKDKRIVFAIVENDTDELVGTTGFHEIDLRNRTATTGTALRKKFWGKGYGTEAKALVLKYGFDELNLHKVCSTTLSTNPRSQHVLEKLRYVKEGVQKDQYYKNGKYVDLVLFGLFKDDFFKAIENNP